MKESDADMVMIWLYNFPSDPEDKHRTKCEQAVIRGQLEL